MANINLKLEYWKNRLLDLGKRNRLINCPLPKATKRISRTSLLINQPNCTELWSIFAEGEQTLEFPIPVDIYDMEEYVDLDRLIPSGINTN